jgi:hypothetical protein
MADHRAKELIDLGNRLFTKRDPMLTLWQEISEHFFVERADFTDSYVAGEDFRPSPRKLLSQPAPSRARQQHQRHASPAGSPVVQADDPRRGPGRGADQRGLPRVHHREDAANDVRHRHTKLVRATKEVDHDFVTFGQGVMSVEENDQRDGLFFRSYHLRDCAWVENSKGEVDHLHRRDKMTARQMARYFGESNLDRRSRAASSGIRPRSSTSGSSACRSTSTTWSARARIAGSQSLGRA